MAELELAPYTLKPCMDATVDPRVLKWLEAHGVKKLLVAGCALTSCVRVSSQVIKRARPSLDVFVDLELAAAREINYEKTAADDPMLVEIYGDECEGASAADLAVLQMREAGVRVLERGAWDEMVGDSVAASGAPPPPPPAGE